MKYRIVSRKAIYKSEVIEDYSARECWYVERRFLFFLWIKVKGFWWKELAESYYKALTELNK